MAPSYLLPGECDHSHRTVSTHGLCREVAPARHAFLSIPRVYEPRENDVIIGIVIVRTPDLFLVDINSAESAILPIPAFDNGCLPTRQAMNRLSVVYTRVVRAEPWLQAELSCQSFDPPPKKSNLGLLNRGSILRCSLGLCDKLRRSPLLVGLNGLIPDLRVRIARNGFIWYQTDTTNAMIAVKNVLLEHETENNIQTLLDGYRARMHQLQRQDDNLVQMKKDLPVKKPATIPKAEPSINNPAVTRLLHQVVNDVLKKMLDEIERESSVHNAK